MNSYIPKRGDYFMKGKDECSCWRWKHGICLIILGVLIWLNAAYGWLGWAKFVAVIAVLMGLKKLILGACCCKK